MAHRIEKISSLIRKSVSEIISRDLSIKKGVFLTVSKVDTSADLRYARVFVSVFPVEQSDYAQRTLEKEIFRIQKQLNGQLAMKILPKIIFVLDKRQEKVSEIEKIFEQIKKENRES